MDVTTWARGQCYTTNRHATLSEKLTAFWHAYGYSNVTNIFVHLSRKTKGTYGRGGGVGSLFFSSFGSGKGLLARVTPLFLRAVLRLGFRAVLILRYESALLLE